MVCGLTRKVLVMERGFVMIRTGATTGLIAVLLAGCATQPPAPGAPKGLGWSTNAQGYHLMTAMASSSSNGNTTTTTQSQSSNMVNVRHNVKVSADDVTRELAIGHTVSDYEWNLALRKIIQLEN